MTQKDALNILKLGFNVFLTGAAGSGKTYVLNTFIKHLRENDIEVGIAASTGIAATHMGGMTIHSWAGIGIRDSLSPADIDKILSVAQTLKRLRSTKVLIIDEISMLHGVRLDLVDQVARVAKAVDKPFGGMQVVLCGDLFQLPPITKEGDVDWIFNAQVWQEMALKICYLQEQHRQEDSQLLDILNSIRSGQVEEHHFELLNERMEIEPVASSEEVYTRLYTHNTDVERINNQALKDIDLPEKTYTMTSKGPKRYVQGLISSCLAPENLVLKVGAEVMFVANNFADKYVNGTRGRVVAFTDEDLPVVVTTDKQTIVPAPFNWQLHDGENVRAEIFQLPLRLAWAITVHKSQGMSLDGAEIDLSRAFEPGMGYVALSRVRTLDGIYIKGANNKALQVHPLIQKFDQVLQHESKKLSTALANANPKEIQDNQKQVRDSLAPRKGDKAYNKPVFEALKKWRLEKSQIQSVPAFVVMADKTLRDIAELLPKNNKALTTISGIGPKKIDLYGKDILRIVDDFIDKKS